MGLGPFRGDLKGGVANLWSWLIVAMVFLWEWGFGDFLIKW